MGIEPKFIRSRLTSLTHPSLESSPFLELKAISKHLKYAYQGEQETLSVIVASDRQEENLITVLRKHRETIGWTMTDIKGLIPAIVQR